MFFENVVGEKQKYVVVKVIDKDGNVEETLPEEKLQAIIGRTISLEKSEVKAHDRYSIADIYDLTYTPKRCTGMSRMHEVEIKFMERSGSIYAFELYDKTLIKDTHIIRRNKAQPGQSAKCTCLKML